MELAKINTKYYCGIDLHSRKMYVCVMDRDGRIYYHRNMQNDFDEFKRAVEKYLPNMSVGVESMHSYYWLADSCIEANIPFYLGHAYYMKTIHGGKKKNDKIDSKKIADLMRSNHLPIGYVYPKEMRAARDLLRRRHRYMRIRSEAYTHIQTIFRQQCVNITGKDIKSSEAREKLLRWFDNPEINSSIEANLDIIEFLNPMINKLERQIRAKAKEFDRTTLNLLLTVPGIGEMLSLNILYEIGKIERFKSAQKFSSYCRLVKCERESGGKKYKSKNQKIGNSYLKWSIGEIIIHAARTSPVINKHYERLISRYGKGKAKSIISHKFGVAIYYMLKNKEAFDEDRFVRGKME